MPTDYSKDDYNKTVDLLTGYGARIAKFNQGEFQTKAISKSGQTVTHYNNKSLGGGYCAGVSLDWVRRALLGGQKASNADYLSYKYGLLASEKSSDELKQKSYQNVYRMANAWQSSNSLSFTSKSNEPFRLEQSSWKDAARGLDTNFDKTREMNQRGKSDKPFSKLILIGSKMETYKDATAMRNDLFKGKEFRAGAGEAIQIGFNGASGHAVAVWRRRQASEQKDSFYFFDPNYGVFSYDMNGLEKALRMLFWYMDGDTPSYNNCSLKENPRMNFKHYGPEHRMDAFVRKDVVPVKSVNVEKVILPRNLTKEQHLTRNFK